VLDLRIYDEQNEVAFSTDVKQVGNNELGGEAVQAAIDSGKISFELLNSLSIWDVLVGINLEDGDVVLRTVYPLRAERDLRFRDQPGPLLGILELTQDITSDYETVLHLQRLIILTTFMGSAALYGLIFFLIRKADRVLDERLRDKDRLEKELLQNEKLASMGRMVASIAHEIRNPLGIIRSSAELLLKRQKAEGGTNVKMLEAIFHESKRLSQTVNDFLDYARPRQPSLEDVDLEKVVRHAVGFLTQEGQEHGVVVESSLAAEYVVQGDRDLLYRGFYNLISNAIQACDDGGQVRIMPICHEGQKAVLVQDTGTGFDSKQLDRYVEPFFTTKDTGTGLGLAVVHGIVHAHGGVIEVESEPGRGTRFEITFPCGGSVREMNPAIDDK